MSPAPMVSAMRYARVRLIEWTTPAIRPLVCQIPGLVGLINWKSNTHGYVPAANTDRDNGTISHDFRKHSPRSRSATTAMDFA